MLQGVVLIAGGVCLLTLACWAVGGPAALWRQLPDEHVHLVQPVSHPEFPWTGVVLGMPLTSIWYWCTDQSIYVHTYMHIHVHIQIHTYIHT